MSDLRALQHDIHLLAVEKGWWDDSRRELPELLMLVVTEAAEAMEAWREGSPSFYAASDKPEGWAIELADIVIRVLDIAEHYDLDMNELIEEKMAYNRTRPYRHGCKRA